MQSAPGGEVYVLNLFTGTLRVSAKGSLQEVPEAIASPKNSKCDVFYPPIGVRFDVAYRPLGGRVYYRVEIRPAAPSGRSVAIEKWNNYIDRVRRSAEIQVRFMTADNFQVAAESLDVSLATNVVDDKGARQSLLAAGSFEASSVLSSAMARCAVTYSGFENTGEGILEPAAKTTP
jgi:hypothetical protein